MSRLQRAAPQLGARGRRAAGGVGFSAACEWKGAPARSRARQGTAAAGHSDPGRASPGRAPRPHVRPPGRADARGRLHLLPPAGERKDGDLRVRSASAPRAGHTQRAPREAAGAGSPGCGTRGGAEPSLHPGCAGPAASTRHPASRPGLGGRGAGWGGAGCPGGGRGGEWEWRVLAYLGAECGRSFPGWRRGRGGGAVAAPAARRAGRGRAPFRARPALPALAVEGTAASAPRAGCLHWHNSGAAGSTQGHSRPAQPAPARRPARPSVSLTRRTHPEPAPLAPLAHTALLTPLSGFVSAHTHVLTQIPSLHTPSPAPFPPYFPEGSPHLAYLPHSSLLAFSPSLRLTETPLVVQILFQPV
jgi:hypothetical protein